MRNESALDARRAAELRRRGEADHSVYDGLDAAAELERAEEESIRRQQAMEQRVRSYAAAASEHGRARRAAEREHAAASRARQDEVEGALRGSSTSAFAPREHLAANADAAHYADSQEQAWEESVARSTPPFPRIADSQFLSRSWLAVSGAIGKRR